MLQLRRRAILVGVVSVALTAILVVEFADWNARRAGSRLPSQQQGVVVVLGLPSNNALTRAVQRWRVDMGIRAFRRCSCSTIIFTGGTPKSSVSEASQMATLARHRGFNAKQIILEEDSTTTWENVTMAEKLIGDAAFVVIVSDGVHADRARRYWQQQFPRSTQRILVDPEYRLFDHFWLKTPSVLFQLLRSLR